LASEHATISNVKWQRGYKFDRQTELYSNMSVGKGPPKYLHDVVETSMRKRAVEWHIPDCGLSAALRFSVVLNDDSRIFVKASTDDETEQWLRNEYLLLSSINTQFTPDVIAWIDTPEIRPVLICQDLSHAYWPATNAGVSWRNGDFDLLFDALRNISSTKPPKGLPEMQNRKQSLWSKIARNPEPFLNLKLCSEHWLAKSIDALIHAESRLDVTGTCLVHNDIRSDNICILGNQIKFVDWSHAAIGSGSHDLATLLPNLHLEGGPLPYEIRPDGGSEAASQSSAHILRLISQPSMPEWLKTVFKKIIAIELDWATSCLDLEKAE